MCIYIYIYIYREIDRSILIIDILSLYLSLSLSIYIYIYISRKIGSALAPPSSGLPGLPRRVLSGRRRASIREDR